MGWKQVQRRRAPAATLAVAALALAVLVAWGCGGGGGAGGSGGDGKEAPVSFAFDDGPFDAEAATEGSELFREKGCSACHAFGTRVTGPDLAGVTRRRTREWLTRMIRQPDLMTREDQEARALLAQFAVQMPNLKLDEQQAHQLVEYFRSQDGAGGAGKEE